MCELFANLDIPIAYTPGDHEWIKCPDPITSLGCLRDKFFRTEVLGLQGLCPTIQGHTSIFSEFVENYRFEINGVMFVVAHITGADGSAEVQGFRYHKHTLARELFRREFANFVFVSQCFKEAAYRSDIASIVLIAHADILDTETLGSHGQNFLHSWINGYLATCQKPLLWIHGDSHEYRYNYHDENYPEPLRFPDRMKNPICQSLYPHFVRLCVPGDFHKPERERRNIEGVKVSVTPTESCAKQMFQFELYS